MSSYHDFRRRSLKRRFRQKIITGFALALSVSVIVGMGWYGIGHLDLLGLKTMPDGSSDTNVPTEPTVQPVPVEPTATPMMIHNQTSIATPNETNSNWNTSHYDVRVLNNTIKTNEDGTTAMDFRLAGLPEQGLVDLSYFDGTAFLGDSITQGFETYDTEISNVGATFCTYRSVGPQAIVNLSMVAGYDKVEEVALDALFAENPSQIYLLLGTNTLVADRDYSSFLQYYGVMIDMIYERSPDVTVYVQSITPVRPSVRSQKSGLYTARLVEINDALAALALEKGCHFLNLWEVLADENGDFREEYAASDGIHMNPTGYQVWIDYLRTHTAYTPGASYAAGTSYRIDS